MRKILIMLALACIPLVLTSVVLWADPGGHRHGNTPEPTRSAIPSASATVPIPDVRYTLTELREALPVPTDVGDGFRTIPGGVDRKNPRSMVTEQGVPVCHQSSVNIGQMEEWLFG